MALQGWGPGDQCYLQGELALFWQVAFFFFFNLVGKPDFLVKELEEESWYSWCLCLGDPR